MILQLRETNHKSEIINHKFRNDFGL